MKRKYLAFDIETATVLPENEKNWKSCRPLGIACAATLLSDTDELILWQGVVGLIKGRKRFEQSPSRRKRG